MIRKQLLQQLTKIFQDTFDDDTLVISDLTTSEDIEDWDSLAQITLISSIEDMFDVQFKMEEVRRLQNIGEMLDLIQEKLG